MIEYSVPLWAMSEAAEPKVATDILSIGREVELGEFWTSAMLILSETAGAGALRDRTLEVAD